MTYREWVEYAIVEYDVVSKNYNYKVYENIIENKETHENQLVQLTLREVLQKCEGTNFEEAMRKAVMKCVYTNSKLEREIKKVMDPFFEVSTR